MVAWVFSVKENMDYWLNDLQTWTKITCTQTVLASGFDQSVYKLWVSMKQMANEKNLSFSENIAKWCRQCKIGEKICFVSLIYLFPIISIQLK